MAREKLDKIDKKILRDLQRDGRITNVELAKNAGISAPPCLRRVRALEESGYIKSYHAKIDPAMMGYSVKDFPIDRTVASLYFGFSLFFSASSMLLGALLLLTATALKDQPAKLRPVVRAYTAGMLVLVAVSMNYFIWPPTVCLLVAFGLAAFSMARLRKAA